MATNPLNDMAQLAADSFSALFGEDEKDIEDAGFDPSKSAWQDEDDGGDDDDE